MQPRFRKVAVFVGSAALATGVGVGVAAQGDSTSSSQAAPTTEQQAGRAGGAMDLSALAAALGVTTDELQAAMDTARSSAQGPDDIAAALAKELGLDEDDVAAALEANRPDGGRGAPPDGALPPDGMTPPDGTTAPDATATPDGATPA